MINGYDIAYALAAAITSPFWLLYPRARRKVFSALSTRMGTIPAVSAGRPAILIHAVSLGEINATRALVQQLRAARPDLHLIVSTTTETGYARARELYGNTSNIILIRYPLDFTCAISRILDNLHPDVVVLMELEVWPNFLRQCRKRSIPVLVINARLTPHSLKRYRLIKPIARSMFRQLAAVAAQDRGYADQFISLGVASDRVSVTGTMKFDTAEITDTVPGASALAADLYLSPDEPLLVCGSTGPGEEKILLDIYRDLLKDFPALRVALIPRHPERFDEVARLIEQEKFPLLRRSSIRNPRAIHNPVILGDTMGELRKFYSLATVVFVGRTLLDLGPRQRGSDMIEPAALAKPTLVGPWTQNFTEVMNVFRAASAIYEIHDPADLRARLREILYNPVGAAEVAHRAQDAVGRNQGATAKHLEIILAHFLKR